MDNPRIERYEEMLKSVDLTEKPEVGEADDIHHRVWGEGMPEVSVVVSRGRRNEEYWADCLASVAGQVGLSCWELVEVRDFDRKLSIGEARNIGASRASGQWILFFDDDDILRPKAIRTLLDKAIKESADMVNIFASLSDSRGKSFDGFTYNVGLVKKSSFPGYLRLSLLEDVELMCRYLKWGLKVERVQRILYYYRLHSGQVSLDFKVKPGDQGKRELMSVARERGFYIE